METNLAERRPLSLTALVHVIVRVGIRMKDTSRAKLVHGEKTDPRGIPEAHCAIFMPSRKKRQKN